MPNCVIRAPWSLDIRGTYSLTKTFQYRVTNLFHSSHILTICVSRVIFVNIHLLGQYENYSVE